MNLTDEFYKISGIEKEEIMGRKETFYDSINKKIDEYDNKIDITSYNRLILIEEELERIAKNIGDIFGVIEIEEDNYNLKNHFEGIKAITFKKLKKVTKKLEDKKLEFINKNIELVPEYSGKDIFLDLDGKEDNNKEEKEYFYSAYEQELKMMDEYDQARKSLSEIKSIQKLISVNLLEQNEQIENIVKKHRNIKKNVKGTSEQLKKIKDSRKITRRALFVLQICVIFILLFLHFFY